LEVERLFSAFFVKKKLKVWRCNFPEAAKPFLLSKIQSALHLSRKNQQKPSKQRLTANLSKTVRQSDSPTKSKSILEKHRAAKTSISQPTVLPQFYRSFAQLSPTLFYYFSTTFLLLFSVSF
jgi:hypothetical protein